MKNKPLLFGLMLLGGASLVQAQDGPYVGLQISNLKWADSNFKDSNTYGINMGMKVIDNFAVELSYLDFGDTEDDILPIWTISGETFGLGMKMFIPISEQVALTGRLGVHRWDIEISTEQFGTFFSKHAYDPYCSLGFDVDLDENLYMGVEYTVYDINDDNIEKDYFSTLSLNLNYRF
jgi:hypothetical protein